MCAVPCPAGSHTDPNGCETCNCKPDCSVSYTISIRTGRRFHVFLNIVSTCIFVLLYIANKSRLLRKLYAIAGFERFKTLLRVQIDVFLTRINVFLTQLTPFLRNPYVIRAHIARHVQPRTTDPNCVKLPQKLEFVRDQ